MGGSISVFPIEKDGKIGDRPYTIRYKGHGQDSQRQEQPHLHCVEFTPDGKHLVANDLGLDCIHKYPVAGNGPKVTQSNFIKLIIKRHQVRVRLRTTSYMFPSGWEIRLSYQRTIWSSDCIVI